MSLAGGGGQGAGPTKLLLTGVLPPPDTIRDQIKTLLGVDDAELLFRLVRRKLAEQFFSVFVALRVLVRACPLVGGPARLSH